MNRTRMFYQDHLDDQHQPPPGGPNFVFPSDSSRGERRISGGENTRPNYASVESPRQSEARYRSASSHHRRSSSNSSNTAFNYNNSDVWSTPAAAMGAPSPGSGNNADHYSSSRKFSRQSSHTSPTSMDLERPQTLELPMTPRTPLRSSLRKNSTYSRYVPGGGGGGSSGGTPTNPTPPDSLSEEVPGASMMPGIGASRSDSGFVSTSNRVRFSPSPFEKSGSAYVTDWSPTHEPPLPPVPVSTSSAAGTGNRQIKAPFPMQRQSRTTPSSVSSASTTHHYITESDLQRDFNLYPQS